MLGSLKQLKQDGGRLWYRITWKTKAFSGVKARQTRLKELINPKKVSFCQVQIFFLPLNVFVIVISTKEMQCF